MNNNETTIISNQPTQREQSKHILDTLNKDM